MPRILIVEDVERTLRVVGSTLGTLDYDLLAADDPDRIRLELRDEAPDLILVSAAARGGRALEFVAAHYGEADRPVPVVVYGREPRSLPGTVPPDLDLGGVLNAPLDPGELLRLIVALAPPKDGARAIEVIADLGQDANPEGQRLPEPSGTYELGSASVSQILTGIDRHDWTGCLEFHYSASSWTKLWFEFGQLTCLGTRAGRALIETAIEQGRVQRQAVPDVPLRHFEDECGLLMAVRAIGMHEVGPLQRATAVRLITQALAARDGAVRTLPDETAADELGEPLPVVPLVIEAVRRILSSQGSRGLEAHPDAVLSIQLPPDDVVRSWVLPSAEEAVLAHLHRARNREITLAQLQRVVEAESADASEALAGTLALLSEMGYVRFCGRPFSEHTTALLAALVAELHRVSRSNHFEVLKLTAGADGKAIKKALGDLSKKHHPDRYFNEHPRVSAASNLLYARYQDAYEALSSDEKRKAYAESLTATAARGRNPERAEIAMRLGHSLMKRKKYMEARQAFRDAGLEDSESIKARVLYGWAWYLGAPDDRRRAHNHLKKVVKNNRGVAEAWYYLGRVHSLRQDPDKAAQYFRKAAELDPGHVEAQREVRLLDRRQTGAPAPDPGDPAEQKSGAFSFLSRLRGN